MENGGRLPSSSSTSSVSSVSMLEVKAETRLVLQAFLHRTANIPLTERPGRVGGAYRNHNKHRYCSKDREGWDSQNEDLSSGDERKNGFMGFIKLPQRSSRSPRAKRTQQREPEDELVSPQLSSDEEDSEKKKKLNTKKIKQQLSKFFKKRLDKEKDKEKDKQKDKENYKEKDKEKEKQKDKEKEKQKDKEKEPSSPPPPPPPTRPSTLPLGPPVNPETAPVIISPSHPPEFYEEVAERLEQIAYRSSSIRRTYPKPHIRHPSPPPRVPSPVYDKDKMVQRLVELLTLEGDAINNKIESDPFLRAGLSRLSYGSFARLQDAVINDPRVCEVPAPPPDASPTLRRIAISMEVSRHIVTATGTQRLQGYAECYMENFAPWVKRQGGWENVVDLEDEFD
ncbi:hypothetical protein NL108_017721 [Boleophthalmus pectinirostris]|uniref:splicing regulatory glutamine/lysine-rich protein 1 n=1 Tax=Boleophthalmus pectinirostris TaxID=150288 RepID=UPI00242FDFAF|nr:splicing regulatory glutamine/lysine-rich protein 1 [Boleophthalmus pectinirostris]KAJ0058606.1 hypothetical protein NL108_017721 [Boleophthalmus pectinirostris]